MCERLRSPCNLVCGDRDTGAALVAHPVPQLVSITGSTRAGIAVAASAANTVKRAHFELGGKAPVLIFNYVNIEAAVEGLTAAGYFMPVKAAPPPRGWSSGKVL